MVIIKVSRLNSYFRGLKPGQAVLDAVGGAHKLQSWPHNILTGV
jgi:queuine tRNA-ribosyltransferase catalytic subunit